MAVSATGPDVNAVSAGVGKVMTFAFCVTLNVRVTGAAALKFVSPA